eukprot:352020-Chlamydomonas_euryale.AAC.13
MLHVTPVLAFQNFTLPGSKCIGSGNLGVNSLVPSSMRFKLQWEGSRHPCCVKASPFSIPSERRHGRHERRPWLQFSRVYAPRGLA